MNLKFEGRSLVTRCFGLHLKIPRLGWDQRLANFNGFPHIETWSCYSCVVLYIHVFCESCKIFKSNYFIELLRRLLLDLYSHEPILTQKKMALLGIFSGGSHCKKYRNYTWFPGMEILRKGTFPHSFGGFARNYAETVPFRKISTPGNQVKSRYFSQCQKIIFLRSMQT